MNKTINTGNNETLSRGIIAENGGYLALSFTQSKFFKTYSGAAKWLAKRGYAV